MSDIDVDATDTGSDATQTATAGATPPEDTETGSSRLLAGKYKSQEDLEQGYLESQKLATKEAQRASAAEKALQEANTVALLQKTLAEQAKIAADAHGTSVADERAALEAQYEEMTGNWDKPAKAIFDMAERVSKANERDISAREAKLRKELDELRSSFSEMQVTQNPVYQQNRKAIDRLKTMLGVSPSKALEAFEAMAEEVDFKPTGAPAPGSTANSRPAGGAKGPKMRALNAEEIKSLQAAGLSDEEIANEKMPVSE